MDLELEKLIKESDIVILNEGQSIEDIINPQEPSTSFYNTDDDRKFKKERFNELIVEYIEEEDESEDFETFFTNSKLKKEQFEVS